YDHLQRLKTITYSNDPNNTPQANFSYDDPAVPYSAGRITKAWNSNSTTKYLQYDAFGAVRQSSQYTPGSGCPDDTCTFAYTYNLTGALTSEQYPSGRIVNTDYDEANRPIKLTGSLGGSPTTYVDTVNYFSHGAIQSYNYNSSKLVRNYSYNSS